MARMINSTHTTNIGIVISTFLKMVLRIQKNTLLEMLQKIFGML